MTSVLLLLGTYLPKIHVHIHFIYIIINDRPRWGAFTAEEAGSVCARARVCYNIIVIIIITYRYIVGASADYYIILCYIVAVLTYTVCAYYNIEKRVREQNTRAAACARDRDAAVASPARVVEVARTACLRRRERARVRSPCVSKWITHERRDSCSHDGARWRACSVCADVSSAIIIIIAIIIVVVIVKEVIGTRAFGAERRIIQLAMTVQIDGVTVGEKFFVVDSKLISKRYYMGRFLLGISQYPPTSSRVARNCNTIYIYYDE